MSEEVKKQIKEMLSAGVEAEETLEEVSEEITEEVKEEEITEEIKEEEKSEEETKDGEVLEEEDPKKEEVTEEDDPEGELKRFKDENEELRKKLNESLEKKEPTPSVKETPAEELPAETPFKEVSFLDDDVDFDDLSRNPTEFNKLLNKVYKAGVDASRDFQESTLKNIPDIVKSNVVLQTTLKKKVDEFYDDNKDLKPFKKAVAAVYEEVAAENPDWNMDEVFNKVEEETRLRLELHKKAIEKEDPPTKESKLKPRFPKIKSSRITQPSKPSRLLTEIDAMNEIL